MYIFGSGAVLSTLFFMTLVSIIGNVTNRFISDNVIKVLNIIVGLVLVYFALKLLIKKEQEDGNNEKSK